jgi:AcrR family transcriptional regulator
MTLDRMVANTTVVVPIPHNQSVADLGLARRRRRPTQERAHATVDAICAAAAEMIEEGGITTLTTNEVARRAGVSITAVYAYFPDKWAIVHELFERFERARAVELGDLFEAFVTSEDWAGVIDDLWDRMARFRIETSAGVALRQAMLGSPRLADLDRDGSVRAATGFAAAICGRNPAVDPEDAYRAAWVISLAAGPLIDDAVRDGRIAHDRLNEGKRMMIRHLEPLLGPAKTMPGHRPGRRPRSAAHVREGDLGRPRRPGGYRRAR